MRANNASTAASASGRPIDQNHGSSRKSITFAGAFSLFSSLANSFLSAALSSRVSSTSRCASGDSVTARAILDFSGSSNSSKAKAVNFGSSIFMSDSFGVERNKIFRGFPVMLTQCLQRCVNENTYVVRRRFCDIGNLPIAQVILKFQP